MAAHRACVGCGNPAAYGPWCVECIEGREVNTIDFGDGGGVPWQYDVPRHFLDQAAARAITPGPPETTCGG